MQDILLNIKYKICEYLNLFELVNVLSTCKSWRKLYNSDNFWSYLTYINFGYKVDNPKGIYLAVGRCSQKIGHYKIFNSGYKIDWFNNVIIIEHFEADVYHHYIFNMNKYKNISYDGIEGTYIKLYIKENKKLLMYDDNDEYSDGWFVLIDTLNGKMLINEYKCQQIINITEPFKSGQYKYQENRLLFENFVFCLDTLTVINNSKN